MSNEKNNKFKVTVKSGDKEASVEIPLGERYSIGMDSDGTGSRAIQIVKELIKEIKEL